MTDLSAPGAQDLSGVAAGSVPARLTARRQDQRVEYASRAPFSPSGEQPIFDTSGSLRTEMARVLSWVRLAMVAVGVALVALGVGSRPAAAGSASSAVTSHAPGAGQRPNLASTTTSPGS